MSSGPQHRKQDDGSTFPGAKVDAHFGGLHKLTPPKHPVLSTAIRLAKRAGYFSCGSVAIAMIPSLLQTFLDYLPWAMTDMLRTFAALSMRARICNHCKPHTPPL
jgi:hypothetical protein